MIAISFLFERWKAEFSRWRVYGSYCSMRPGADRDRQGEKSFYCKLKSIPINSPRSRSSNSMKGNRIAMFNTNFNKKKGTRIMHATITFKCSYISIYKLRVFSVLLWNFSPPKLWAYNTLCRDRIFSLSVEFYTIEMWLLWRMIRW